jgi:hypothetical protein
MIQLSLLLILSLSSWYWCFLSQDDVMCVRVGGGERCILQYCGLDRLLSLFHVIVCHILGKEFGISGWEGG